MNPADSLERWTADLDRRPEIFPHQVDLINDKLLLVELSAADISAASFLDQRVLKPTTPGAWLEWQRVADIFAQVQVDRPPSFIFHVGHCGSTLLSRLLQLVEGTNSLREPLPLRTLAQDVADLGDGRSFLTRDAQQERLQTLSKMWSRGAACTVIKATSVCTDLLPQIHSAEPATRSVFVYNRAATHIATMLAGQNALVDLKGFAKLRLQRLQQKARVDIQLSQLNLGQLAALSWLSETTSVIQSPDKHAAQIFPLEFDALIENPAETLTQVLNFLDLPAEDKAVAQAVRGPVLQSYSKAPEHPYNAETRAAILAQSRADFAADISEALAWLKVLAAQCPLVAASMEKFA